jgi:NAD-dependent SIR2 family protein deacetylase
MSIVRDPLRRRVSLPSVDAPQGDAATLADALSEHRRIFVLTGAGCSTDSGIPAYRGADGEWRRQQPVQFQAFMGDARVRARYWARSLLGWRSISLARPNDAHLALATLERSGLIGLLVTQNVDGLHQAAGSRQVTDLHGRLDRVVCMACRMIVPRTAWQHLLQTRNASWESLDAPVAPDGDADLEGLDPEAFDVPACAGCGGVVKPDVVFFGESIPPWRHTQASAALATSDAMLIVGSSLMVHSGYRYAVAAARAGKPVYAVNLGRTRADHLLTMKASAPAGVTLSIVADNLSAGYLGLP